MDSRIKRALSLGFIALLLLASALCLGGIYRSRQISHLLGTNVAALVSSAKEVAVFEALEWNWVSTGRLEVPDNPMQKVGEAKKLSPKEEKEIRRLLLNPRSYAQDRLGAINGTFLPEVIVSFRDERQEVEFVLCITSSSAALKMPTGEVKGLCILPIHKELARLIKPLLVRQPSTWP